MADAKKPVVEESAEVQNLREREKILAEKVANLEKADANEYQRRGFDIHQIKHRAQFQLQEVKQEIAKLTK